MPGFKSLAAAGAIIGSALAYPAQDPLAASAQQALKDHPYVAPGPNDARAPCPLLNTLANHGFLPHDGKNLSRDMLITAIGEAVNVEESAIDLALINAFHVCEYVEGRPCETLTNLTVLAEPHAFEHEHSMSRADYHMAWAHGAVTDNRNFNQTIFDETIGSLEGASHMNYAQAATMRLLRQANSLAETIPGWFELNVPVAMFEVGFIYAIMGDFNLPDYATTPQVRVEWWQYWFEHEALPVPLGWHKPQFGRDANFMLSVSSAIVAEHATKTAEPQPPHGADNTAPAPGELPSGTVGPDGTVYPLVLASPYKNPPPPVTTGKYHARSEPTPIAKRDAAASNSRMMSALSAAGPAPTPMNMYAQEVKPAQIAAQISQKAEHMSKVQSLLAKSS